MKIKLTLIMFTFFAVSAHAGTKEVGNGGVVVTCKNTLGDVEKVKTFDLYEGKELFNLVPKEIENDYLFAAREKLVVFSQLIDRDWGKNLNHSLDNFLKNMELLPSGVGLKLTEDMGNFIVPKGCELSQLINYRNDGKIYVDSDLWKLLSPTDKAAMVVHEVIYYYLRYFSEPDSSRVRKMVAYLFSETPLESIGIEGPQNPTDVRIQCYSEGQTKYGMLSFLVLKEAGQIKARFEFISGKPMISRSEVIFDNEDGLQSLELQSMIESGITITFYDGTPDVTKLSRPMNIQIKDANYDNKYNVQITCDLRNWK